jgi:hypothetical protein
MVVGTLACFALSVGEPFGVMIVRGSPLGADYSTGGGVFMLPLVVAVSAALRSLGPRLGLSGRQLSLIYTMLLVAGAIPSWGSVMNLLAVMAAPQYCASPSNGWQDALLPNLPQHLIITAPAATSFYEGFSPGQPLPWGPWLRPWAWWLVLALPAYGLQVSLALILRRQWVQSERLVHPLALYKRGHCAYRTRALVANGVPIALIWPISVSGGAVVWQCVPVLSSFRG